jgi:hypothetical protein
MRPLDEMRRYIRAKQSEENGADDVRAYAREHARAIADALSVSEGQLLEHAADLEDADLGRDLLDQIDRARKAARQAKASDKMRAAIDAAGAIGAAARAGDSSGWEIDLAHVLRSCLTDKAHVVVFTSEGFTTAVRMRPLFALRTLKIKGATAFVDAAGLHVRWGSKGGLNLFPCSDPNAVKVLVNLAPESASVAA